MRLTFKITAIAAIFIFSMSVTNAQSRTSKLEKIYGQSGIGPASKSGYSGSFAVQSVWKNNLVATISYQRISSNPKNLPSDYKQGYSIVLFFPLPDPMPEQKLNIISLTAGKFFPSGRKTWFTTEAGLSLVTGDKFTFNRQQIQSENVVFFAYETSNYNASKEKVSGIGGQLKADFNWAFCSFAGVGAGIYANLNSIQSVVGGEIRINVGWMKRGQKAK